LAPLLLGIQPLSVRPQHRQLSNFHKMTVVRWTIASCHAAEMALHC
jgi:hypothetical protein